MPDALRVLATLMVTIVLFVESRRAFFPEQDTGFIFGSAEGAQDISSAAMWGISPRWTRSSARSGRRRRRLQRWLLGLQ